MAAKYTHTNVYLFQYSDNPIEQLEEKKRKTTVCVNIFLLINSVSNQIKADKICNNVIGE